MYCDFVLSLQSKCDNVVDKYIEYDLMIISLDAMLLKRPAFRHILVNSGIKVFTFSDFIWPFLQPYMGVIPNPKMAFIFPISCILVIIFPIFMI